MWCWAFLCSGPCFILRTSLVVCQSSFWGWDFYCAWLSSITLEGMKVEGLSSPKPLLEQKLPHWLQYVTVVEYRLIVFCHLLYPCFLFVFCTLASLLSPLHFSLCFHLLFLYTLNPRQSVVTGLFFFFPYSLGNIHILSVFPRAHFNASTGASQPVATSLSSSQARSW